jgi:hypothetical protein
LASPIKFQRTIARSGPFPQRVFIPLGLHGDDDIRVLSDKFDNPLWPYVLFSYGGTATKNASSHGSYFSFN